MSTIQNISAPQVGLTTGYTSLEKSTEVVTPSIASGSPQILQLPQQAKVAGDVTSLETSNPLYRKLEQAKSNANDSARQVRESDSSLEQARQTLDQMKSTLGSIVKNFPPFLPGDDTRVTLLMSYVSLRQQIEQMMIPPDFKDLKNLSPTPPGDSGDAALHQALQQIDQVSSGIDDYRAKMAQHYQQSVGPSLSSTIAANRSMNDSEALQASRSIQASFAGISSGMASSNDSSFLRQLI